MSVHIFGAALDTMVAGIYAYDTWAVEAPDASSAVDEFDLIDPWGDVSTSVEDYIDTAEGLAGREETVADILRDRFAEE